MKSKISMKLLGSLSEILVMGSELFHLDFLEAIASPACLLTCVVAALLGASPAVRAEPLIVVVVTNGTPAPEGNGTINLALSNGPRISPVVINDAGQVTFQALLDRTLGGSNNTGIYRGDAIPGNLTNIIRQGQPAPDGNGSFDDLVWPYNIDHPPTLNNAGQVATYAPLFGTTGGTNNSGLFRGSGGVVTQIVRVGWVAPDGNGTYVGGFPLSPPLNASGQVAFFDTLSGSAPNTGEGIFRGNGTTITQIARSGYSTAFGTFDEIGTTAINDLGQAAYWARISGGFNTSCVFRADGATLTRIAYSHELAPDGNGELDMGFGAPELNNSGQVGFSDLVDSTVGSSNSFGIFRGDGSTLTQIVRRDQAVPGGNGHFGTMALESMNNAGQIVFSTLISGTVGGTNQTGIYRGDGVTLTKIARQGELAPDSSGATFGNIGPVQGGPSAVVAINDAGQVAFLASLSGGGTGIYVYDDHVGLIKVIRTVDSLLGKSVTGLRFNSYPQLGNEGSGLNNHGQIAFSFSLSSPTTYGIAIWSASEFRITDIRTVTNDVILAWNTVAGKTNVVQVTPGGPAGSYSNNFTDLSGNIVVSGAGQVSTNYVDIGGATNFPARYYRIRLVP